MHQNVLCTWTRCALRKNSICPGERVIENAMIEIRNTDEMKMTEEKACVQMGELGKNDQQ